MLDNNTAAKVYQVSLTMRMLIGGFIGLFLITLFVISVDRPNPAWGSFWMIRPLLVVTFAGAMGGLCNFILLHHRHRIGMSKLFAILLSLNIFIIGLWMGVVLGLNGTLWN